MVILYYVLDFIIVVIQFYFKKWYTIISAKWKKYKYICSHLFSNTHTIRFVKLVLLVEFYFILLIHSEITKIIWKITFRERYIIKYFHFFLLINPNISYIVTGKPKTLLNLTKKRKMYIFPRVQQNVSKSTKRFKHWRN